VFAKDVRKLEIQTWGYHSIIQRHLIENREVRAVKGDAVRLVLATIPIQVGGWGPRFGDANSALTFGGMEPKMVAIRLKAGWRRQTHKVQIYAYPGAQQWAITIIDEERDPFSWPLEL